MSLEENKAIVKRWNEETINRRNLDAIDELADPNYVNHGANTRGPTAYKQSLTAMLEAFSDGGITIEDTIAEGDKVVIRWKMHGTHTGEYQGVPATGKKVTVTGISVYRLAQGKIVEDWSNMDELGYLQQLDVIPPLGG
jgi:steroid delta-isomerase-like uncharacterized protein